MIDVFEKQKHEIDIEMLSVLLKTPIVAVNVKKGRGIEELAARVKDVVDLRHRTCHTFRGYEGGKKRPARKDLCTL
ncbi:MAG: hypothetical protein IPG58_11280 [Acidobacteria bacterium]|nr:hypothetical protein [Acidobacteriota bacterium]